MTAVQVVVSVVGAALIVALAWFYFRSRSASDAANMLVSNRRASRSGEATAQM